jgi:hypothetical protein
MPLDVSPLDDVVNVHWGGVIIQISIDVLDDYMDAGIARNPHADFDPDPAAQTLEYDDGQVFTFEHVDGKWRTYFASKDESDLGDFYYNDGFHFREFLINFAALPPDTDHPESNPEVRMISLSTRPPYFEHKGEARLRIYPVGTIWRAIKGQPSKLEADQEPSYDKTKVTPYTDDKIWSFNEEGWLDDTDLGEYDPITERPPREDGGGPVSISTLSGVAPNSAFHFDGTWWPCVVEIEGVTGISIHPPASHVDGSGIINTGAAARVDATCRFSDDGSDDIPDIGECAILDGTGNVLASGDRDCSVVFSGEVKAAVRLKGDRPGTRAIASISSTFPA